MDDIEAIKQLKARYFRTMDTKDWAGMREVFADDVTRHGLRQYARSHFIRSTPDAFVEAFLTRGGQDPAVDPVRAGDPGVND